MTLNNQAMSDAFVGSRRQSRVLRTAPVVIVVLLAAATLVHAQSTDPANIAEGMRLFMQKGNCQACHGWSGDGRKVDNQMPDGANLRETRLDRKNLVMIVKCGLPGTGMPAFDKFAYSDGRCFGKKQADLTALGLRMADPPDTLQAREIELLADFMFAKVVGKGPMNRAKCAEYWDSAADVCTELTR